MSARLANLVAVAKRMTGIATDTELVELALPSRPIDDEFGKWLVGQAGRLKEDFVIDL